MCTAGRWRTSALIRIYAAGGMILFFRRQAARDRAPEVWAIRRQARLCSSTGSRTILPRSTAPCRRSRANTGRGLLTILPLENRCTRCRAHVSRPGAGGADVCCGSWRETCGGYSKKTPEGSFLPGLFLFYGFFRTASRTRVYVRVSGTRKKKMLNRGKKKVV